VTTAESLDYAERWMSDSLRVLQPSVSVSRIAVDMTQALRRLDTFRRSGVHVTSTHLVVHAAARALAENPKLHQIVTGTRRHRPARVDIGLSVSGEAFVAPVLVIERADEKSVEEIAAEVARRTPETQQAHRRLLQSLRRFGWLVPFGPWRRALLGFRFASVAFRRKTAGTFQVTTVPVDWALTSTLVTSGVLTAGRISSHVVAVEGQPVVRPIMSITLSADHAAWDGRAAARFLAAVQSELESIPEPSPGAP
jgi:pyruvate dehydrogenase E2 component (dihydrolipoamide acetyltransferase)